MYVVKSILVTVCDEGHIHCVVSAENPEDEYDSFDVHRDDFETVEQALLSAVQGINNMRMATN